VVEVSGVTPGLVVDKSSSASGTSSAPATGVTAALTAAETFQVAVHAIAAAQASITVGVVSPAWTQEYEELPFTFSAGEADSRITTSSVGTTPSASWTDTASAVWAAVLVAFAVGTAGTTTGRVTQDAIEVLALPAPPLRVTQDVVELLSLPTPPLRVSQYAIEILASTVPAPTTSTLTQVVAETLTHPTPDARTSQVVVETITPLAAPVETRVTQLVAETLTRLGPVPPLVTQLVLETVTRSPPAPGRVTQAPLELLVQVAAAQVGARVSQAALEILYPFDGTCYLPPEPTEPLIPGLRYIRRLRRAPHVQQAHHRIAYASFALDLQRGVGLASGQGADPLVTLRVSRDGGRTFGEPVIMRAGRLGAYTTRVRARRLGQARDAVFEVTVSDPVAWALVQAWLDLEPEQP
jgi:hypothetical protein